MNEPLINLETAMMLKSAGFDWKTFHYACLTTEKVWEDCFDWYECSYNNQSNYLSRPSVSQAIRWLREVHKAYIVVEPVWNGKTRFESRIITPLFDIITVGTFDTYDQAESVALTEALKIINEKK